MITLFLFCVLLVLGIYVLSTIVTTANCVFYGDCRTRFVLLAYIMFVMTVLFCFLFCTLMCIVGCSYLVLTKEARAITWRKLFVKWTSCCGRFYDGNGRIGALDVDLTQETTLLSDYYELHWFRTAFSKLEAAYPNGLPQDGASEVAKAFERYTRAAITAQKSDMMVSVEETMGFRINLQFQLPFVPSQIPNFTVTIVNIDIDRLYIINPTQFIVSRVLLKAAKQVVRTEFTKAKPNMTSMQAWVDLAGNINFKDVMEVWEAETRLALQRDYDQLLLAVTSVFSTGTKFQRFHAVSSEVRVSSILHDAAKGESVFTD